MKTITRNHCYLHARFDVGIFVAFLVAVALSGCTKTPDQAGVPSDENRVVTRSATSGPVELRLTLATDDLTVNDHAKLVMEVSAVRGVTVHVDDYLSVLLEGDRRFELGATFIGKQEAVPDGDERLRWRYEYDLTGYLPGEYELPAASVSFTDMREGVDGASTPDEPETTTLATEPIALVVSDVRTEPLSETELADIHMPDPVELRRPVSIAAWIGILAAVLAVGFGLYLLRRRKRQGDIIRQIPAHLWAREQLAALVAADLLSKGLAQEYYYRISGIVRGYVERRFSVSAPDMTTEEFLAASRDDPRFGASHASTLGHFLTACDLVKYARHEPASHEADQALRAAEEFVEQTRLTDEPNVDTPSVAVGIGGEAS